MKSKRTADRFATACTVAAALGASAIAFALCAAPVDDMPEALVPPKGEQLALIVAARGVQIYECRASKDNAGAYGWAFVAPEAELLDAQGRTLGLHNAGPTWQANDGSRIVGTVRSRVDAPVTDAVPWLLLAAHAEGPAGYFSKVTSIQRVNTVGGVAPSAGCDAGATGTKARVAYTADYRFFTPH